MASMRSLTVGAPPADGWTIAAALPLGGPRLSQPVVTVALLYVSAPTP